jgi:hypothetical protein
VSLSLAGPINFRFNEAWNRMVAAFTGREAASDHTGDEPDGELAREDAPGIAPPMIRFIQEADQQWTVSSASHRYRGSFPDLESALAFARQTYGDAPATLWLNVDGLVVVIPQEAGWPRSVIGPTKSR